MKQEKVEPVGRHFGILRLQSWVVQGNTIILYFGDARNNKNDSAEGLLKKINGRARYSVWLNPDEQKKWNQDDSIIGRYSKCVNSVYNVNTVENLIRFLNDFSLKDDA